MRYIKPKKLIYINGKPTLADADVRVRKDDDAVYNFNRRVSKKDYVNFYARESWSKRLRLEILERDMYICQRCGHEGNVVDHIVPSLADWDSRELKDNLQTLCRSCHQIKTNREQAKLKKGVERQMHIVVICGLPASGKTTYVKSQARSNDLIYDYDALMRALTNLDYHQSNINVHDYITLFYEQMLRKLKSEHTFDRVFIIRTLPDDRLDSLLTPYHHIEHILIDTDVNTCRQRLAQEHRSLTQDLINRFKVADFSNFKKINQKRDDG